MTTAEALPSFGDVTAPTDSVAYAVYVRDQANACLHKSKTDLEGVQLYIKLLHEKQMWTKLRTAPRGRPFRSWTDFCLTERPFGLGRSPQDIEAIVREAKDPQTIALRVEPLRTQGRPKKDEEKTLRRNVSQQGNNREYRAARLARDHPDVFARLKDGDFATVAEAERAAGLVKTVSAFDRLKHAWKKASAEDRAAFLAWIKE